MKNVYRWLAGWMAALCLLTALAAPVSAEGFDYTWDQDTENNPGGPHCKAYLMLNLDTDTVVYSDNADEQLPMASLTKIMTYIVAYENIPDIENAQITIPQSVVDELSGTGSSVATFDVGGNLHRSGYALPDDGAFGQQRRLDPGQVCGPAVCPGADHRGERGQRGGRPRSHHQRHR